MKTIASAVALVAAFTVGAHAQNSSSSGSSSGAQAVVISEGSDSLRTVPGVVAPGLATGTCMGSTSVGGAGMGWGFSFGSTRVDEDCNSRMDAALLSQLAPGTPIALYRMCQSNQATVRALEAGGFSCAAVLGSAVPASAPASAAPATYAAATAPADEPAYTERQIARAGYEILFITENNGARYANVRMQDGRTGLLRLR